MIPQHIGTPEYYSVARVIGARLKAARINAVFGQRDVFAAGACDRGNLSRIENGKSVPSILILLRLCKLYKVYPGTILEDVL